MQKINNNISQRGRDKIDRLVYKAIRNNEYGKLKISTI
jgi:ribosomal protein L31E